MYVNPFERMRKKREEEEKEKIRQEKEQLRFVQLGAQMGLSQDDELAPSFIKNSFVKNTRLSAPPFGLDYTDYSVDNTNDFQNDFNKNVEGTTENFVNNISFTNDKQNSLGNLPFETEERFEEIKNNNDFFETTKEDWSLFNSSDESNMISNDIENDYEFSKNRKKTTSDTKVSNKPLEFDTTLLSDEWDFGLNDYETLTTPKQSFPKQLSFASFKEDLRKNSLSGNCFLMLSEDNAPYVELIKRTNHIIIDLKDVFIYSLPYLYLVKKIISALPFLDLDDKRTLWERTSLFLSTTEYGKQASESSVLLEDFDIDNPISFIWSEFSEAFEAYEIEDINIPIVLNNFKPSSVKQLTNTINFIQVIFGGVKSLKFLLNIPEAFLKKIVNESESYEDIIRVDGYLSSRPPQTLFLRENKPIDQSSSLSELSSRVIAPIKYELPEQNNNSFADKFVNIDKKFNLDKPQLGLATNPGLSSQHQIKTIDADSGNRYITNSVNLSKEETNNTRNVNLAKTKVDLLNPALRINVDKNLQRKREENIFKERDEELARVEKFANTTFNPAFLVDPESTFVQFQNRKRNDLYQQRKDGLMIDSNDTTKPLNNNLLSVPGNWKDLND
ncbi:hypothetical protein [Spiroplasma apis]|uniref:Uncharacterized protein n=1 Tax=Spiroplasma apis B31 TaxID=1276258 RepID=V5RKZ9_SPIAP|nr:hypothetical protein [Spiroplasma apis]AHB36801.1 hypothetical protein SAPIS_v1c09560 [Spiroplasma apis B31]